VDRLRTLSSAFETFALLRGLGPGSVSPGDTCWQGNSPTVKPEIEESFVVSINTDSVKMLSCRSVVLAGPRSGDERKALRHVAQITTAWRLGLISALPLAETAISSISSMLALGLSNRGSEALTRSHEPTHLSWQQWSLRPCRCSAKIPATTSSVCRALAVGTEDEGMEVEASTRLSRTQLHSWTRLPSLAHQYVNDEKRRDLCTRKAPGLGESAKKQSVSSGFSGNSY